MECVELVQDARCTEKLGNNPKMPRPEPISFFLPIQNDKQNFWFYAVAYDFEVAGSLEIVAHEARFQERGNKRKSMQGC